MTRFVIIAVMNLLVVGSIAASALFALVRGCNMDGTCSGNSNMLTWVLGIGLGSVVIASAIFMARTVLKRRRDVANQEIVIASIPRQSAVVGDHTEESGDGEAMLSRLARMTRTAAADTGLSETTPVCISETADDDLALDQVRSLVGDFEPDGVIDEAMPAQPESIDDFCDAESEEVAEIPYSDTRSADLHVVVRDGERAEHHPYVLGPTCEDASDVDGRYVWLFDDCAGINAACVRRDIGFPWSIAGIDHVCQGISRFGLMLAGTDIASEASAWCQITASLPRGDALADDDAVAFTDWLNSSLRLIGRSGEVMIEDAMDGLEAEAASDPAVARCLPRDFWTDDHSDDSQFTRFG